MVSIQSRYIVSSSSVSRWLLGHSGHTEGHSVHCILLSKLGRDTFHLETLTLHQLLFKISALLTPFAFKVGQGTFLPSKSMVCHMTFTLYFLYKDLIVIIHILCWLVFSLYSHQKHSPKLQATLFLQVSLFRSLFRHLLFFSPRVLESISELQCSAGFCATLSFKFISLKSMTQIFQQGES